MVKKIYILFFLIAGGFSLAQPCKDQTFLGDSVLRPSENKKIWSNVLTCPLKNGGHIQFVDQNGKFFLKLSLNEKFGFEDEGPIELKSGTKSFFVKSVTLYDAKKPSPYFVVEILINYVATLKDNGLTSVVFNKFEAKLNKQDVDNIEKAATCFYSEHSKK